MTRAHVFQCPRCHEPLPAGLKRCDSCGAYLVAAPKAAGDRRHGTDRGRGALLLVVGLVAGGATGYALHSAVGPRAEEEGMPTGPADVMRGAGAPSGETFGGAGMGGGEGAAAPGGAPAAMPGEVMAAIQRYREALERNPDDVQAHIGMGNLQYDSGQWQRAVEHYTKALEKAPGNPDVRVDLGVAYHNLGQNDKAIQEITRVTREAPTHQNAWFNLGVVSSVTGDRATAIRAWEKYLTLDPNGERSASIREELAQLKRSP